uniref:Homeobox protein cut-like n=1 Tax=Parastrongyloides trichosuri TaxID=131310 RepID=A0A0N4Z6E1_PARTI
MSLESTIIKTENDEENINGDINYKEKYEEMIKINEELESKLKAVKEEFYRTESINVSKTSENEIRIKELLEELDRNALLVDKLQVEVSDLNQQLMKEKDKNIQLSIIKNNDNITCKKCCHSNNNNSLINNVNKQHHNRKENNAPLPNSDIIINELKSFIEKNNSNKNKDDDHLSDVKAQNELYNALESTTDLNSSTNSTSNSGITFDTKDLLKLFQVAVNGNDNNTNSTNTTTTTVTTSSGTINNSSSTTNNLIRKVDENNINQGLQDSIVIANLKNRLIDNIRNLGTQALNTEVIARECKRLMTAYNIGQRLFAKVIMNQSQGTVSELLSKPKHWNNLTDKGRDAFRRIYGWISDEEAITTLYSLSPRKVSSSVTDSIEHPTPKSLWDLDNTAQFPNNFMYTEDKIDNTLNKIIEPINNNNNSTPTTNTPPEIECDLSNVNLAEMSLAKVMDLLGSPIGKKESQTIPKKQPPYSHKVTNITINEIPHLTYEETGFEGSLHTELVCKEIREFITKHNCSQKSFAEMVLNMSPGAASDVISKPKSWNNLTPKGREPYIKMQLFLEMMQKIEPKFFKEKTTDSNTTTVVSKKEDSPLLNVKTETSSSLTTTNESVDTKTLVEKLKVILKAAKVTNASFASRYMGMGPAIFEECLKNPRPWNTLSAHQKIPYTKINNLMKDKELLGHFLKDGLSALPTTKNVSPLFDNDIVNSKTAEANLLNTISQTFSGTTTENVKDSTIIGSKRKNISSNSNNKFDDSPPSKKRTPRFQRTIITTQQKEILLYVYAHVRHPSARLIDILAKEIDLNARTITNWFHNYRTRQKAKENQLAAEGIDHAEQIKSEILAETKDKNYFFRLTEVIEEDLELCANGGTTNNGGGFSNNNNTSSSNIIDNVNNSLSLNLTDTFNSSLNDDGIKDDKSDSGSSNNGKPLKVSTLHSIIASLHNAKGSNAEGITAE